MEQDDEETTLSVVQNLDHLMRPSLRTRLALLSQVTKFLDAQDLTQIKAGILKKLYRAIVLAFLDAQYDEQQWTHEITRVLEHSASLSASGALPFNLMEFIEAYIGELMTIPQKFCLPFNGARLVELATLTVRIGCRAPTPEIPASTSTAAEAEAEADGEVGAAARGSRELPRLVEGAQAQWLPALLALVGEQCDRIWAAAESNRSSAGANANASCSGSGCVKNGASSQQSQQQRRQYLSPAQRAVRRHVGGLLRARPELLPPCLAAWVPAAQPTKVRAAAGCMLLVYAQQHADSDRQRDALLLVRRTLLDAYVKCLQTTVSRPQSVYMASSAWFPLIGSVTTEEWLSLSPSLSVSVPTDAAAAAAAGDAGVPEGFEASLVKLMKKAPESGSLVAAMLVSRVSANIDMSNFVLQLGAGATVIKVLKSSDASVRAAGLDLVRSLVPRCSSVAACQLLVEQLCEGYLGKGAVGAGGLLASQALQKRCVLLCLQWCGELVQRAVSAAGAASVASSIAPSLQTIVEKEVDSSIKLQAASVLGVWLPYCLSAVAVAASSGAELPKWHTSLVTSLKTSLEKGAVPSNALCACYLLALSIAVRRSEACKVGNGVEVLAVLEKEVSTPCLAIVREAGKKLQPGSSGGAGAGSSPTTIEAVLALHLLVRLTRTSATVLSAFEAAKLWTLVSSESSFLYMPNLILALTATCNGTVGGTGSGGDGSGDVSKEAFHHQVSSGAMAEGLIDNLGVCALHGEAVRSASGTLRLVAEVYPDFLNQQLISATPSPDSNASTGAVRMLCQFMLLPADLEVRQAVLDHVNAIVALLLSPRNSQSGGATVPLLKCLWGLLASHAARRQATLEQRTVHFKTSSEEVVGSVKGHKIPARSHWVSALLAVFPVDASTATLVSAASVQAGTLMAGVQGLMRCPAVASYALMVCACPLVCGSTKETRRVWALLSFVLAKAVYQQAAAAGESDQDLDLDLASAFSRKLDLTDSASEVCQGSDAASLFCGLLEESSVSDVSTIRQTSHNAALLLAEAISAHEGALGGSLVGCILPRLVRLLDLAEIRALTTAEIQAYTDPAAALSNILAVLQQESDAKLAAEAVITNADRKKTAPRSARRGNFGADSMVLEDEDWAERVKAEKLAKLQQARSEGGAEYEEVKQSVFALQVTVAKKVNRVLRAIEFWRALATDAVDVRVVQQSLMLLLLGDGASGLLVELLRCPLTSETAYQYLVAAVDAAIEPECSDMARYASF
jgi:hypothetical protein